MKSITKKTKATSSINKPEFFNNANWNEKSESLLREVIKFHEGKTAAFYYDKFRQIYKNDESVNEIITSEKISLNYLPAFSYFRSSGIEEITHVGIDFPTNFNYKEIQPVIMIIDIDPLRNDEELKDKISVGTPYALHSKSTQNEGNLYWSLVEQLVKENHTVYLTDTFKLYFKHNGVRSYNISEFTNPKEKDIHQEIFAKEVSNINPDLIITLGEKPKMWFTNIKWAIDFKQLLAISGDESHAENKKLYYGNIPVLPLVHLAAHAPDFLDAYNVTSKEIIPFYTERIKDKLSKMKQ